MLDGLVERFERADARRRLAEGAVTRRRDAERARKALLERSQAARRNLDRLDLRLRELGDGSVASGADALSRRRRAFELARHERDRIRQDFGSEGRMRQEVTEALAEDARLFSDGEEERLETERGSLDEQIQDHVATIGRLRAEIGSLEAMPLLDDLQSEEQRLRMELDDAHRQRDRLALLAAIIRHADDTFRQRHQPDVIRRASRFFAALTAGRYEGLVADDRDIYLIPAGGSAMRKISDEHNWTSRGTRDQLFLAIRLALIDHLDADHIRLPIFLDEVFVNWDAARRRDGLALLKDVSARRQVFLFTCHEWFVDEASEHLSASVVAL
ncbi:MAG: ATP-binding protein, partial [Bacteroidota bacterium]